FLFRVLFSPIPIISILSKVNGYPCVKVLISSVLVRCLYRVKCLWGVGVKFPVLLMRAILIGVSILIGIGGDPMLAINVQSTTTREENSTNPTILRVSMDVEV
ncbi:unnamed protein product, partial (mitochondrion) [Musa textilis]